MIAPPVARVVLGLAVALALAVLAAHPSLRALEKRLGISVLTSVGIPFLLLGLFFRTDAVGVLTAPVLRDLQPVFHFGLGWIGFVVGMQLDIKRLAALPRGLGTVVAVQTAVPMALAGAACGLTLVALDVGLEGHRYLRDTLVFAACAGASAPIAFAAVSRARGIAAARAVREINRLDEVAALAVAGLVAVYFRPESAQTLWRLPPSAWALFTLGLGTVLGVLAYVLLRSAQGRPEALAMLLGAVGLTAGISGYLALSTPIVCAIAGAILANLPPLGEDSHRRVLLEVERPLYLLFLVVVGASWHPEEWQGWALAGAFVAARIAGRRIASGWSARIGPPGLPPAPVLARLLIPQSPIAIVIIVGALARIPDEGAAVVRWGVNAVIVGSVLTELAVRLLDRIASAAGRAPLGRTA